MSKIIIKGNTSQIIGEKDIEFLLSVDKHLSFYVLGAEHTRAFKGYIGSDGKFTRWDGFKKLLNSNLTFPTGLVHRVQQFYIDNNKQVEVVDNRPPKSKGNEKFIAEKLKKLNKVPYQYQLDALEVAEKNDRGIIKLATGGGKSLIAALIAAKFGKKTIIYVIGKDLLYQFHDLFTQIFDEEIGLIGDGHCKVKDINIASVWTIGQALGIKKNDILLENEESEEKLNTDKYSEVLKLMKEAKVHIIDECHMAACDTIQKIYKNCTPEHIYGLSGSPWRDDNADLLIESILGRYIVNIPATRLIASGHLAQPIIKFVPVMYQKMPRNYPQVYKDYVVENPIRNGLVLKYAKELTDKGYQTLILFSSLKHGKILYDLISPHIQCEILDGSNDKETRDQAKQDIMNGKIKCILASKIFDIGVDIPSLSGLIVACGGKSTVKALQRIGRVIRKYPGKNHAAIVDFVDNAVFLKNHSEIRQKIYSSEEGFVVKWPKEVKIK